MAKHVYSLESLKTDAPSIPFAEDHGPLFAKLRDLAPDLDFRVAYIRDGWRRIGGVVRRDGVRVAENLRQYAETEFEEVGPDMDLPEDWDELLATRMEGRTLYLIAAIGEHAWDFVQLEIEVIQEVIDRELFPEDFVAEDIEEFLDPPHPVHLEPKAIGAPSYRFHGVAHIKQLIEELDSALGSNRRFSRFLEDWEASRAGHASKFYDNWALRLFRYTDRFGEQKVEASPICVRGLPPLPFDEADRPVGFELAQMIDHYDRKAGYPMAWFFQVLTAQKNAHAVAEQVYFDHESGNFAYLAGQDLEVVTAWFKEPYCF